MAKRSLSGVWAVLVNPSANTILPDMLAGFMPGYACSIPLKLLIRRHADARLLVHPAHAKPRTDRYDHAR
jgi:hypothetical protein